MVMGTKVTCEQVLSQQTSSDDDLRDFFVNNAPNRNRMVNIPRRVGFDKVVLSVVLLSINWEVFDEALKLLGGHTKVTARDCRKKEKVLQICQNEEQRHWYSSIIVNMGSNTFTVRRCNLPGRRDICLLEAVINPIPDHEILGNIHNLTCKAEQERIRELMTRLEMVGIVVDQKQAYLHDVEINVNLFIMAASGGFEGAMEIFRPYRLFLSTNFRNSDFWENGEDNIFIYNLHGPKLKADNVNINKPYPTSFNTTSKTIDIKVYDKGYETIVKSKGKIDWISPITRIEFLIKGEKENRLYFRETNIFKLTQQDVVHAFQDLFRSFIRNPLKQYYTNINVVLEKYFEKINIHQYAWRKNLVIDIAKLIDQADGYFVCTYHDLSRYVSYIPAKSVKINRARITNSLKKEIIESGMMKMRIEDTDVVEELMTWLCKIPDDDTYQEVLYSVNLQEKNSHYDD